MGRAANRRDVERARDYLEGMGINVNHMSDAAILDRARRGREGNVPGPLSGVVHTNTVHEQAVKLFPPHPSLGDFVFLSGAERARDADIGDRVTLKYHTGPTYGRWMATREDPQDRENRDPGAVGP